MVVKKEEDKVSILRCPHFVELTYTSYQRPYYNCLCCGDKRRKYVSCFEIENFKRKKKARYELEKFVCEYCFEFEYYGKILNDFYETDLY